MQINKNTVFIFDISNFIHRAFHATGELTTSDGFPTGAIWGSLNMMLRFIEKYKPTHMLICYDSQSGKSIRRDIYPQYKANRTQVNSVSVEEKVLRKLFDMMNIYSIESDGYEADDLIAAAVKDLKGSMDVVIVTGDKDLLQLIEPGVQVFDSMKNIWYDDKEALNKFGVDANQISDYLALAGDKADNIPGGAGIGPKAAQDLLASYASIEDIFDNIDEISEKYRDKLIKSTELIRISKRLTSLYNDIPGIKISPEYVIFRPIDNPDIYTLLDRLEFKNMAVKLELMWQAYN